MPTKIEQTYKTLRNHLGKTETFESLYVIWAYARNINHRKPFPVDIVPTEGFADEEYIQKIRWVAPWDLETLAREVVMNSAINLPSSLSFRNPNYFSGAVNKLKDIDGAISESHINVENVMKEMERRLSHRQFGYQVYGASTPNIARYFKIFGHPEVSRLIQEETGLSTNQIFGIGLTLWNFFTDKFVYPSLTYDIPEIQQSDFETFKRFFSIEVNELRELLKKESQVNDKFNYAFHSLKRFPLISNGEKSETALYCPLPDLIFRQITGGVYYLLKWTGKAGNSLGNAFQEYIGAVLSQTDLAPRYEVIPEEGYGKELQNTSDWMIVNSTEALFVECKTKRVTAASKEELLSDGSVDNDLDYIADAVVQVYKTIQDYKANQYPSLKFSEKRRIYPIVVTMEDWFLMGTQLAIVKTKVSEKMGAVNLPREWLEEMPFSVCSAQEFEMLAYILKSEPIPDVIEGKQKKHDESTWSYAPYLFGRYPHLLKDRKELFPNIFKEILPISLKDKDLSISVSQ